MANLSRRSLFGRVVRLPAIFPFKRQQSDDEKSLPSGILSPGDQSTGRRPLLSFRHRRRKESDRQMISINGKQYYVDDDGELKELKEPTTNTKDL